jgi:CDP-glucose 4,6-dehydratase
MQGQTDTWRHRRVLVTGCDGFLGRAVTRELLDRQAHVIGLVREKNAGKIFAGDYDSGLFRIVQGRSEDAARIYSLLAIHEVAAIFHLVEDSPQVKGYGLQVGSKRHRDDSATAAILRAASLHQEHLPVVMAKPSAELRLLDAHAGIPHGIARFGELFGPGDRTMSRIIPRTLDAILAGEQAVSREETPKDFVFVRDAAMACLSLVEAVGAGSETPDVTFRSGWELSGAAMAGLVHDSLLGRNLELANYQTTPTNPFGWQPAMSFGEAIRETIAWYREHARERSETPRSIELKHKAA